MGDDAAVASQAGAPRIDYTGSGWQRDQLARPGVALRGVRHDGGKRNAFVRLPDRRAVVIMLTNDDAADAKDRSPTAIADRVAAAKR